MTYLLIKLLKKLRNRLHSDLIRGEFSSFGHLSRILPPFRSGNEAAISIGENVFIGPNSWIEVIGDQIVSGDPLIRIGDDVSISGDCTITATSKVSIGRGVLIARFVHISDHSHGAPGTNVPVQMRPISNIAEVNIGAGAWICQGVVICPGVNIGRNAVVGANSVVCTDIPDECVAVGAPARIVASPNLT